MQLNACGRRIGVIAAITRQIGRRAADYERHNAFLVLSQMRPTRGRRSGRLWTDLKWVRIKLNFIPVNARISFTLACLMFTLAWNTEYLLEFECIILNENKNQFYVNLTSKFPNGRFKRNKIFIFSALKISMEIYFNLI